MTNNCSAYGINQTTKKLNTNVGIFTFSIAKKVRKPTLLRNSKKQPLALQRHTCTTFQRNAKVCIFLFSRTKRTLPFLLRHSKIFPLNFQRLASTLLSAPNLHTLAAPCLHLPTFLKQVVLRGLGKIEIPQRLLVTFRRYKSHTLLQAYSVTLIVNCTPRVCWVLA